MQPSSTQGPGENRDFSIRVGNRRVLSLTRNHWESDFFSREMGLLDVDGEYLARSDPGEVGTGLDRVLTHADQVGYSLLQVELTGEQIPLYWLFEDRGFRLVDTRLVFLTHIRKRDVQVVEPHLGSLALADESMAEDLLSVVDDATLNDPGFVSRFKNERYFSRQECGGYYRAWVTNHLKDRDTTFAVAKTDDALMGFMMYKRAGQHLGKPLYKGLMVAVARAYRGQGIHLALSPFIFRSFEDEEFYADATTQLSNTPSLINYIKGGKRFESARMIFFRLPDEG